MQVHKTAVELIGMGSIISLLRGITMVNKGDKIALSDKATSIF
ncbi:hypothetical protein [Colwellia sp.]|nr:hypothetical protein [Colwellia sp.]